MKPASLALQALRPTFSGSLILLASLSYLRSSRSSASISRLLLLLLFFINRGNLPLRWHFRLLWIGIRARLRYDAGKYRLVKPTEFQKELGLKDAELGLLGLGKRLFREDVTVRTSRVSFAEADYNLHLSNSIYAQQGDFSRMQYASDYAGVLATRDGIHVALGGTSFVYLLEIPIFATYKTEARTIAFDSKWAYFFTRFTIPYPPSSRRPPSKSLDGKTDVTVCAYLLSRLCFKKGRISVHPEKGFALCGLVGPEEEDRGRNWRLAKSLRKENKVKQWVQEEFEEDEFMKGAKKHNEKALEIIARLHDSDRKAWLELDAM